MTLIITPNPNLEQFNEITQKVLNNDGYCPCLFEKNEDTKCMCKDFREQNTSGYCHCGRFLKVERK